MLLKLMKARTLIKVMQTVTKKYLNGFQKNYYKIVIDMSLFPGQKNFTFYSKDFSLFVKFTV